MHAVCGSCQRMLSALKDALSQEGLILRGGFRPGGGDALPELPDGVPARMLLLVGNAGSAFWPRFRESPEYRDGAPDPLDRWTARVVGAIAAEAGARALFPFEGPPYHPFQRWAQRAEGVFGSPLGLLVHPDYGLWHAYRAALLLPEAISLEREEGESPCLSCAGQPCLTACPVGAFTGEGYDVGACAGYLSTDDGKACLEDGCRARGACPLGERYIYQHDHLAFHMAAFKRSRS